VGDNAVVTHSGPERRPDAIERLPEAAAPTPTAPATEEAGPTVPVARRRVEIVNALGLHLRPAERFVAVANRFRSDIRVSNPGRVSNGKSILDLMTMAAECRTWLDLEARGPDADEALDALAGLIAARFHEDDEGNSVEVSAP
jgi:phosphotransferase system HPr (HPr) family protein